MWAPGREREGDVPSSPSRAPHCHRFVSCLRNDKSSQWETACSFSSTAPRSCPPQLALPVVRTGPRQHHRESMF